MEAINISLVDIKQISESIRDKELSDEIKPKLKKFPEKKPRLSSLYKVSKGWSKKEKTNNLTQVVVKLNRFCHQILDVEISENKRKSAIIEFIPFYRDSYIKNDFTLESITLSKKRPQYRQELEDMLIIIRKYLQGYIEQNAPYLLSDTEEAKKS